MGQNIDTSILTDVCIANTIDGYIDSMVEEFDANTDREMVIERLDEVCDDAWGGLVKQGLIHEYEVSDLVETSASCATIIEFAERMAWVEDDHGLWDALTYGVLASIAYFSLRNCFYQALSDKGIDSNDDFPFAEKDDE